MTIDYFVGAMRCGRCGEVSPADASTDMQTKLAESPRMRELGVGAELPVTPERARAADYLTIADPAPGAPVTVLQSWLCPSCDATGWAEITVDGGRIARVEAIALTDARIDASHYILEEDARLEAARATGRDSGEMWGSPVLELLRRRGG